MAFIVISDAICFENEADLINQLFENGMSIFHLRKPDIDIESYARIISLIAPSYHDRIALHQFHELVKDFPLIKRLHYPEKLRANGYEHKEGIILSTSIHDLSTMDKLEHFEYAFYGPVFNSISKPGYPALSAAKLSLPAGKDGIKLIALGGIELDKVEKIKHLGFDGMAVLGAVWSNKKESVLKLKSLTDKYNSHFN